MYSNAGIHSHHNNTVRHVPSTSDPPPSISNSLSSLSSFSIFDGHASRGSEDRIFSASAQPSRPGSVQVNRCKDGITATLAPPSSFPAHSRTSTNVASFTRKPSYVASSSASALHNKNALSSSSYSSFLSRAALSKSAVQTVSSVSRSSSMSRRNGSSCAIIGAGEPMVPQRINMKRLMSKPIAISVPDRAQSVMAFAVQAPPYDTDDSQSIEDYLAIKSHSLDILRRSRRRSRSVDLTINSLGPSSYPSPSSEGPLHRTTTKLGLNSTLGTAHSSTAEARTSGLKRSPSTPGTTRLAPIAPPDYSDVEPPLFVLVDETVTPPRFSLSPASVIALEWTQSQKRANPSSPLAGVEESSSISTIPQAGFIALDSLEDDLVSPIAFADANEVSPQSDLPSPPIITNSSRETEEIQGDRHFMPWASAEQGQRPMFRPAVQDVSSPTTKGGGYDGSKVGVTATMREVSRRITGAFGRGEKKPSVTRFPINHPPSSVSAASFSPDLDSNTSFPSSFSARAVSKAPSHPRARALTMSCITGAVKNDSLASNHSLQGPTRPLVAYLQPPNPFTTEFGQLNHTPLSISSLQDNVSERDNSVEVAALQQHPSVEMPNWSLLYPSSPQRTIVDENDYDWTLARQTYSQPATPPLSPIGQISSPARNNSNPNSPRKRSRSTLGIRPSHSAFVPVGRIAAEGTETKGSPSHVLSSASPSLALNEGTVAGGKLRGLVKKLSSGSLRRNSDKSRSSHTGTGDRAAGADNVPPVPQIPKDFELIWDPDTFLAERARLLREAKFDSDEESTRSGQRSGGPNTTLRIPSSSHMSSSHSSLLGHKEQMPADASSLSSSVKSRLRVDTELDWTASSSKQSPVSTSVRRKPAPSIHGVYPFPGRANPAMEDSSPRNFQVGRIRVGSHSSSPSRSGPDLHAVNRLHPTAVSAVVSGSFEEQKSLSSHSHEMVSSYPNSIIAQPIMSPRDLYQHGEDEAATLKRQQNKESSLGYSPRNQNSVGALPASRSVVGSQKQPSAKPPPPTLSPRLLPLTAPPPRPPRRGTRMRSSTVLDHSMPRPMHHHPRSLSSPTSPTMAAVLTTKGVDPLALSKGLRSVGGRPRSPQPSTFKETPPSPSTNSHSKSAGSISLGNKANHLLHRVVRPRRSESTSSVSPNLVTGESTTKGGSQPKIRVKTSLGTITRAKGIATPNSASHTPSSSTSYTLSLQSSGNRTSPSRTSRDHSFGQGWVTVGNGDPPPVPFTSTAFTFREISPVTGPSPAKGRTLTDREREDLWNALLSRSDRVGGTLTVTMDQTEGPALLSDNASFRED